MNTLTRLLAAVSGRRDERHPPTRAEAALADALLCLMLLAVILWWRGGQTFVYEGF